MRRFRFPTSVLLPALLVVWAVPAAAEETPAEVVSTRYTDVTPAASSDYLAWVSLRSKQQPLWVQPTTGERFRVNAKDTWAIKPEIEGTLLVYTEGRYDSDPVDIRFFDLSTGEFVDAPEGVNTVDAAEWWPSISEDLLMFSREDPETSFEEIIVIDMLTGESQTIASSTGPRRYFVPGQINGDLVVWTRVVMEKGWARFLSTEVFVHDLSTGQTTMLDNPGPKDQFGASVDASGTVYYGRAGAVCGRNSHLMSVVPGEEPTVLVSFDSGRDFYTSYARDNADGSTTVFFDPGTCVGAVNYADADIWSLDV